MKSRKGRRRRPFVIPPMVHVCDLCGEYPIEEEHEAFCLCGSTTWALCERCLWMFSENRVVCGTCDDTTMFLVTA